MTVLGRALSGAVAGVVGTVALDLVWYARYRRDGGESSFGEWDVIRDLKSWDDAPAPGQVGRKIVRAVTGRDVPVDQAAALSNLMHWAYGVSWTAGYALFAGPGRPAWRGPAFGALVWSSDYVTLPLAGVYEPIWKYDLPTLWKDLSAHLVFGTAADAALRVLPG